MFFVLLCVQAFAVPARPGKFPYTQPDGSVILIERHGDEWGHWTTNAAGQVVEMDEDGFYRVVEGMDNATAARLAAIRRSAIRREVEKAGAHIALGQKHFCLILVEFKDKSFTISDPQQAISNMLNQQGYQDNGATGSARDYYYQNSHGAFEPVFDVYGPVTLSNNVSYYGGNDSQGNDKNPDKALIEAVKALDSQINFADYDLDNDSYVDLVYWIYAGKGEADGGATSTIWPHQWSLTGAGNSPVTLDGKKVNKYACGSELDGSGDMEGIGTICHEFGHAMGLPDFYDTDYATNGQAGGLYAFSLMDMGSYNNSGRTPPYFNIEERIMLGWLEESAILPITSNGTYTLPSVNEDIAYKIPTDTEGEYFLLECRDGSGWDAQIYGAVGLVVYHVDKSSRMVSLGSTSVSAYNLWNNWESYNAINENGSHPCFYVIPAVDQDNLLFAHSLYYGNYYMDSKRHPEMTFPGSKSVTSYTAKSWNGVETEIQLSEISYSGGKLTFTVSGLPSTGSEYPVIENPGNGVYSAGSVFNLSLDWAQTPQSIAWYYDGNAVQESSVTLSAGSHLVEAVITIGSGKVATVSLEISVK